MAMETLPSGTILQGRYRIERALGSGGFGHVYLAVDLQTHQQYAIKEYLVSGQSGKAQLQHEARVLSQLHHPNLPAFQEAFDERGRYYVVLGYIEGNDLTDYIRIIRTRNDIIPLAQVMTWILSISDAVTFLHRQLPPVIHRDIKPDNIRIMSNGTAMLVDLGNAKAAADGARTLFFIRHQGTPGYAPLEQYPGGSGTDVRSDVYALAGTLYFALTAHEPPSVSTRNQAIAQGLSDLPSLQERLKNNPPENSPDIDMGRQFRLGIPKSPKPAQRHSRHLAQLGTLPPPLLKQLDLIIQRAMAMNPKDRYQSVADFSNDLRQVLLALPAATQPSSTSSAQAVDPHGTQPDLPLLSQAMQEAKENQDASSRAPSAAPPSRPPAPSSEPIPPSQPASPLRCPKCNAELVPHAVFCPRCGTSLTRMQKPDATTPTQSGSKSNNNPAPSNKSSYDIAVDPTLMITPQMKLSAGVSIPGTSRAAPKAAPAPTLEAPKHIAGLPAQPAVQNRTPSRRITAPKPFIQTSPPGAVMQPVAQTSPGTKQARNASRSSEQTKTIILLAIILIILVLIGSLLVLFISHKAGTLGPLHLTNARWFSFAIQVL